VVVLHKINSDCLVGMLQQGRAIPAFGGVTRLGVTSSSFKERFFSTWWADKKAIALCQRRRFIFESLYVSR
ncbi:hypothetical protein ACI29J_004558, partial [Escherichia coli]